MKKFLFEMFLIGCLNLIIGCDLNILDTPPTAVIYDAGFYTCCDYYYLYKEKN